MKLLSYLIETVNNYSEVLEGHNVPKTSNLKKNCLTVIDTQSAPRDTVVITDISGSMNINDFYPTRLGGAIEAGIEYVNARKNLNDRIALVSFSTYAKIVLPLTNIKNKGRVIEVIRSLSIDGETDINKGLQAAVKIFSEGISTSQRYVILLTDGHGGHPLKTAMKLKEQYNAVIEVVGIGGSTSAVNESLLRKIATTDVNGFNHYRFIKDSAGLKKHYKNIATGLIWKGGE
ncbi:MAG: VWA domain-containing protein [Anaerohalosphaeraceae bacterium]|nr:VWA domain-containing protein [Anaerohalosphaeraceae bacterium]